VKSKPHRQVHSQIYVHQATEMLSDTAGIVGDDQLREGFVSGFLLIFFSEIGDKTFFVALLLALRYSRPAVFVGTLSALAIMTVISVLLGQVLHVLDEVAPLAGTPLANIPVDDLLAAFLLIWFGIQTLQVGGCIKRCAPGDESTITWSTML
jgi:hypothetical protein